MPGVSFDRAAGFYDATRGLPDDVMDQVAHVLATELSGRGRCLEIGVGTGRIALPLLERGIDLAGIDLSRAMLARLRDNAAGAVVPAVAVADAMFLPVSDGAVGAVLSSHVLHLIAGWQEAVEEACRVLSPGGSLLVDFGGGTHGPWDGLARQVMARHGIHRVRPGLSHPDPLADYLAGRARRRSLRAVHFVEPASLAGDLDEWRNQILAWTWPYEADQMGEACDEIAREARAAGWSLEEQVQLDAVIQWWAFDLEA